MNLVIFVLFSLFSFGCSENFCLSSWHFTVEEPYLPPEMKCDAAKWDLGIRPDPRTSDISYCTRKFLTDLGDEWMGAAGFEAFRIFLSEAMRFCFVRNVGHTIWVGSLDALSEKPIDSYKCCSTGDCNLWIDRMDRSKYIRPYGSEKLVFDWDGEFNNNYTGRWVDQLKVNWEPCAANSVVFITSRIIDFETTKDKNIPTYFRNQFRRFCAEMTVIVVGRAEANVHLVEQYYKSISAAVFVVPDVNCLVKLAGCLSPCRSPTAECADLRLSDCPMPSKPTLPPTLHPLANSLRVLYVFAFSDAVSSRVGDLRQTLLIPIEEYSKKKPLSVAFFYPTRDAHSWITTRHDAEAELEFPDRDLLRIEALIDNTSKFTPIGLQNAVDFYADFGAAEPDDPKPVVILLTDFVSQPFLDAFGNSLKNSLEIFSFRIYVYNALAFDYFQKHRIVEAEFLYPNDLDNLKPIRLDGSHQPWDSDGITEGQLILIIVGSVVFFLLVLIIGTVLYRGKNRWLRRIERFTTHHQVNESSNVIEDHWELSWDRLLIKSEKIGSGAYGQVFRGKLHGKAPCAERLHTDRPHLMANYENCDVAIKMLPKYATDSARREFMNEIELMKTIGFNENIVNMLGCITVGPAVALILEYCPNRDLHQYVKALKIDVNNSESLDIKINFTKEFMLFGWQIADGMRFLSAKHIIHRDLAARNILIDGEKNAKISDFGLCIILDENYLPTQNKSFVSSSGRLPVKWLAPEALLRHEFSSKSDVWAFGMILFEMYSFGMTPFYEIIARELADHIKSGNRPPRPELCPDEIYDIMQRCWQMPPDKRPTFQELLTQMTLLLERATEGYGYLQLLKSPEDYAKNKLALAKSFKKAESPPNRRKSKDRDNGKYRSRISSVSDYGRPTKHRPNSGSSIPKISKKNSQSSNHIDVVELELGN